MTGPRILVDADACPVKAECETVATRHRLTMVLVSNGGVRPSANPLVQSVYVGAGLDEADRWIEDAAGPGDIVVTADIPLAARAVAKGARVVTHTGEVIDSRNAGERLAMRDLMADLRSANPLGTGGGKAYSRADRSRFADTLDRLARSRPPVQPAA